MDVDGGAATVAGGETWPTEGGVAGGGIWFTEGRATPGDVGVVVAAGLFVLASVAYRRCPLGPLADEIAQKVSEAASTEAATTNKLDRWIARTFSSQHSKRRRWGISD